MTSTIPESVIAELREMRIKLRTLPLKQEDNDAILARFLELRAPYKHDDLMEAIMAIHKEIP